jgi:hypothetical protein
MNILNKFTEWEKDDDSQLFYCLFTTYNPNKKEEHLKTYFDLENEFVNKKYFAQKIIDSLKFFEVNYFTAQLKDPDFSWIPSFIGKKEKTLLRDKLNNFRWKENKYFGQIIINDNDSFLEEFLDYPFRYSYQDIVLISDKSDLLILLSYHGTIWFLSENKNKLSKVKRYLEESGITVKPSRNMQ